VTSKGEVTLLRRQIARALELLATSLGPPRYSTPYEEIGAQRAARDMAIEVLHGALGWQPSNVSTELYLFLSQQAREQAREEVRRGRR
jgi:hypothetical protein